MGRIGPGTNWGWLHPPQTLLQDTRLCKSKWTWNIFRSYLILLDVTKGLTWYDIWSYLQSLFIEHRSTQPGSMLIFIQRGSSSPWIKSWNFYFCHFGDIGLSADGPVAIWTLTVQLRSTSCEHIRTNTVMMPYFFTILWQAPIEIPNFYSGG